MNTQLPDYQIKKSLSYLESMIPSVKSLNGIGDTDNSNINLKVITKYAEQKKWNDLFIRSYSGEMTACTFSDIRLNAIFLVICEGKKELGYMRLTTGYDVFGNCNGDDCCVNEAYIKPAYRGKGVFREALKLAIKNHHVKIILLEEERAELNANYYQSLGFIGYQDDGCLVYLLHEDLYHQSQIEEPLLVEEPLLMDDMFLNALFHELTTENEMVH